MCALEIALLTADAISLVGESRPKALNRELWFESDVSLRKQVRRVNRILAGCDSPFNLCDRGVIGQLAIGTFQKS
jgi:hypothetical protein